MYAARTASIATPIGMVRVSGDDCRLTGLTIDPHPSDELEGEGALREAAHQLRAYFAGQLDVFDLPLAPASTRRGDELRAALLAIPFGETRTYGALALTHGSSARAIGGACRKNPFPIVVPCHRVVSAGATDFYSAGAGPETKAWLLAHERTCAERLRR